MDALLLLPLLISFFVTFLVMPKWIKKAGKIGLVWEDMNKPKNTKKVAGSGGLIVVMGFILAVLFYISIKTFYTQENTNVIEILALTTSILILSMIGLIDDLLGWWHGGLSKRFRILMCLFAAVPLVVINAGSSFVSIPFLGRADIGLIYAFFIIPMGIIGASTTFNFLAGFNGLEAGLGAIILSALSLVAYLTGSPWLALIGVCFVLSLLAFLFFNKYPAKVFPGDVLTYPVGGMIAIMAILGNMERIALFFFAPYMLEVFLKVRGGLKKHSFGKPNKKNDLEMPYDKIYGLEHLAIWFLKKTRGKATEKGIVYAVYILQIAVIVIGLAVFRKAIF